MDETAAAQHHTTRSVFLDKAHPAAWRALNGLGLKAKEAADDAGLDQTLIELLNVRISQINGCAYCLDLHVGDAVKNGETAQRLAVLPAWRDTDLFTRRNRRTDPGRGHHQHLRRPRPRARRRHREETPG